MKTRSVAYWIPCGALAWGLCWSVWSLQAGTVAWYRFEEGGTNHNLATNIVDSGTNGLHGLASPPGLLRYAPAKQAYPAGGASALAFFGSGLATLPNPALGHAFTLEMLIRPFEDVPDPAQWQTILTKQASEDPQSDVTFKIEYRPLGRELRLQWRLRDGTGQFSMTPLEGTLARSPNGWNHPVLTFSGGGELKWNFIVDGSGWYGTSSSYEMHADLGAGAFQLGGGFYGLVDELRICDSMLETSELLVHFPLHEPVPTITPKVEITFPTYRFSYYDVDWTHDLNSGVWQHLEPTPINGTGFPITVVDPGGFGQQRFYRVYEYD